MSALDLPTRLFLAVVFGGCVVLVVAWWRAERGDRRKREAARRAFLHRPILKVGTVQRAPEGRLILENWYFDYSVPIPIHYAIHDGTTVHTVMLGYTEEELLYIAAHPEEFEEVRQ